MSHESQTFRLTKFGRSVAWVAVGRTLLHLSIGAFLLPALWRRRLLDREDMASLSDSTLKDIGLTREQVTRKYGPLLWDRPERTWSDWR